MSASASSTFPDSPRVSTWSNRFFIFSSSTDSCSDFSEERGAGGNGSHLLFLGKTAPPMSNFPIQVHYLPKGEKKERTEYKFMHILEKEINSWNTFKNTYQFLTKLCKLLENSSVRRTKLLVRQLSTWAHELVQRSWPTNSEELELKASGKLTWEARPFIVTPGRLW